MMYLAVPRARRRDHDDATPPARRRGSSWAALVLVAVVASCDNHPLSGAHSGHAGAGGATGGGGQAGGTDSGVVASPCPEQAPAGGATCDHEGLTCSWGNDVRGDMCRTLATCTSLRWQVTIPTCAPLQDVGACPMDTTATCAENTTCLATNGITCRCTRCRPDASICRAGDPFWYCPAPQPGAGCPPTSEPNFGAPCDVEGATCTYFSFMCGQQARVCSKGVWTAGQPIDCPISTRRAKKDIRYLSAEEVNATAAQALRLRLATYEYKAAPFAGRRHLGFILEDSPTVPAVDRDGDMVDLYGYTSMLLATVQAQQRQIDALQEEVETLLTAAGRGSHAAPKGKRNHGSQK
jgi:hypothetical protein